MISSVLLLSLATTPDAVYFFQEGTRLYRAELALQEPSQTASGPSTVRARRIDVVKVPGAVVSHSQRGAEDILVACVDGVFPTDEAPECDVMHVDAEGSVRPLKLKALSAQGLADGRVAYWTKALELRVFEPATGESKLLARHVFEPRLSADGRAFGVGVDPSAERFEAGHSPCPAVVERGVMKKLDGPCEAQAPFISSSGAAAFVSTKGGTAALYLSKPSGRAVRVGTGASAESRGFIPVPASQLAWIDAHRAVYAAHYADETLWLLDVNQGTSVSLGRGREPLFSCDGARCLLLAVDGQGESRRLLQYETEVRR